MPDYDFSGMATVYGVKCSDGKTILPNTFKHQDGVRVPLMYQHGHGDMTNIVGNGVLKHQADGVRIYGKFNQTEQGKQAKEFVRNKDLTFLSVWANRIVQHAGQVSGGDIKEVSLVIAGANPKADIDDVIIHSTTPYEDDVIYDETNILIHTGVQLELPEDEEEEETIEHAEEETVAEILATFNEDQMKLLDMLMHSASSGETQTGPGGDDDSDGPTFNDIRETLNDKQATVLNYVVGSIPTEETIKQSDEPDTGETDMPKATQNIFETSDPDVQTGAVLNHADLNNILAGAIQSKAPSLKNVFNQHLDSIKHADPIEDIELLFPDPKDVRAGKTPYMVMDDQEWVGKVLNGAFHSPFSKVKSRYADITAEEARARGYVTSAEKFNAKYKVFTRSTDAQTVYTKNTTDRDDVIDITEFDVLVWIKGIMQIKLREEVARAVLIGDGRAVDHADKINDDNIRPIYTDDDVYAHKVLFAADLDNIDLVDDIVGAQVDYKGSGNPVFFTTTAMLIQLMKTRDLNRRRMYETKQALADALMVSQIVTVPVMSGVSRADAGVGEDETANLLGIIVNMRDYTIGANMGGKTAFFQGFDIDFNQHKQLLETRVSGALTIPKAALVIEQLAA